MTKKSDAPAIRFKGFSDAWEQRKLGDIGKARSGVGFPDADQGGVTGVPFFKVSDMNLDGNENEMIVANNYVTAEQIADHRWSPITELPAIFFAKVGAAVMLNRKRLCRFPFLLDNNTMAYSLSPTKWDADFAKALFGTVDLTSLVQVGALPSYNAGDVESMGIYLPSLFEQEQIGAFFKLLDNLITLHQRKCANLCSPSQVVFSLLFVTSTFSWEQRKFGEITSKYEDPVPTPHDGYYRLGIRSHAKGTFHSYVAKGQELETAQMHRVAAGNFIVNITFGWEHAVAITDKNDAGKLVSHRFPQFSFAEGMVPEFFRYVIVDEKFRHHLWLASPGGAGRNRVLKLDEMLNYLMRFPSRDEQIKIAEFFRHLDNLITLHQRKCANLCSPSQVVFSLLFVTSTFSWEQRKLTEFVEFFSGLTYTPNDVQENGTLVLRSSNVSNGEVVDADNIYVNPQVVNSENVKVGDIVVVVRNGSRSLIGKHAQIKAFMPNTVIGAFMTGIRSECPEFTNALLNTSRFEEEIAMNMGATINQITGYMFSKMEFKVPCLDEQKKIGEYFEKLDNLITLHQRKFEKLTNVKKSMLEKMFPQNGSSYPEIRFKGFTDPWEQRKLGDVVQITMGQSPDGSTYSDEPSDYILVQGNADLQNGWVCPRIWTTQITKKADAGDLIMSVRAPAGAMGKTAYNAVIGRGVAAIKGNEFIYQLLVKMDADGFWKTLSCGSTFESLNSDNIKNAEVKIPTTAEQIKIGGYFQQLDNLITLHQRELEKLQNIKKSMLEKMFV